MKKWNSTVSWFLVLVYLAFGLVVVEKTFNYYRYFSDISVSATTEDGHRCLTLFNPEPVMACYKIDEQ